MIDYSYLFDSEKIYSENILSFYDLFNNRNTLDFVNESVLEKKFFLYLVYPNEKLVKQLFQNDELLRFRLIDFFSDNVGLIQERDRKIQEFLLNNDIEYLDSILKFLNNEIDISRLKSLKYLMDDMVINKEIYLQYILSQVWTQEGFKVINIDNLCVRLIILYYFNIFFIEERSTELKIDNPDYIEFTRLLIKHRDMYNINDELTTIVFKSDKENSFMLDRDKYLLLRFFNTLKHPTLITKNVIAWFYIFFSNFISERLHNDILYIILGFKKNTIGFIMNILKSYNKDYYKMSEEEKENIIEDVKNDYIFRENEKIVNQPDIKNYINNLILLENLKKKHETYKLLSDIKLSEIKQTSFFFILSYDPLHDSWQSIINKVRGVESKFENLNIAIKDLIKYYNSIHFKDFDKATLDIINIVGEYKKITKETIINNLGIFDKDILFYNFICFLNNFEILIFNKEYSLSKIIGKYNIDINKIKNIFQEVYPFREFYNGYKRFE